MPWVAKICKKDASDVGALAGWRVQCSQALVVSPRSFASAISLAYMFKAAFRTMELLCGADVICSFRVRRCAHPRGGAEGGIAHRAAQETSRARGWEVGAT